MFTESLDCSTSKLQGAFVLYRAKYLDLKGTAYVGLGVRWISVAKRNTFSMVHEPDIGWILLFIHLVT